MGYIIRDSTLYSLGCKYKINQLRCLRVSLDLHMIFHVISCDLVAISPIARFMGPTWGPSAADRTQVGPMLAPWTLLSGMFKDPFTPQIRSLWPSYDHNKTCIRYWYDHHALSQTLIKLFMIWWLGHIFVRCAGRSSDASETPTYTVVRLMASSVSPLWT